MFQGLTIGQIEQMVVQAFWPLLKAGLLFTIPLAIISFVLGLILAFLTALARLSGVTPLVGLARFYVWIFRGTPLLVQLFVIFYGLPSVGLTLNAYVAGGIGFTLNVGAYNSEIIRAAILSTPKGQWEAASALGMTYAESLRRIIIPQASRVAVPPLANSFISLVKDTSLGAVITVAELFHQAQVITATTYQPLILYCEAGFIYLIFCTVLSSLQERLEKYFSRYAT
jgi:L-cystine transport system permease protein